ncbi:MAG: superinfection immunity protein [Actinoallomurus sp.]
MSSAIHAVGVFPSIVILVVVYFLPFLIACWRRHPHRWLVLVIDLFGGVSGLGWIAALVVALWMPRQDRQVKYADVLSPTVPPDWRLDRHPLGPENPGHPAEPQHEP